MNQLQWLGQGAVGSLMTGKLAELDPLIRGGLIQIVFRNDNKRSISMVFVSKDIHNCT